MFTISLVHQSVRWGSSGVWGGCAPSGGSFSRAGAFPPGGESGSSSRALCHRPGQKDKICKQIEAFLAGDAVAFSIDGLDFEGCGEFERRVLLADFEIPRGRVMTYGGLAEKVGVPGGARAVGNVMAGNPFPLAIPCHRVIRSDGTLGGFGGGLPMKRALLEMEGVAFDGKGRVLAGHIL